MFRQLYWFEMAIVGNYIQVDNVFLNGQVNKLSVCDLTFNWHGINMFFSF